MHRSYLFTGELNTNKLARTFQRKNSKRNEIVLFIGSQETQKGEIAIYFYVKLEKSQEKKWNNTYTSNIRKMRQEGQQIKADIERLYE